MSHSAGLRTESTHHRLYEFAKSALVKIFVHPYATVCELYCGGGLDSDKWDEAQIGHYIGIDVSSSGISQRKEAWESQRKVYAAEFFEVDPCTEYVDLHLQEQSNSADYVCCLQHLQLCFQTEDRARRLLHNVSALLKPGGYFFGITPDSSTIWAKYQKNVEAYHNKMTGMKPNIVPNCIRSESYMITFEVEEEKFPLFGKKYQLKFTNDVSAETHCLVHFPSFIRLAREAGLEYVEIQNLTEFFDDNRAQFTGMIMNSGPNLVDPRGRLLPRSFDVLGLYTTFIFQKPDPDIAPPLMTPLLQEASYNHDEREWQATGRKEDEKTGHSDPPIPPTLPTLASMPVPPPAPPAPPAGLGNISEQKGILGPGPAELRFSEAL
ncbi:mRNA (guanine-N(7))-methyltransferase domain containing protein [Trema orientale]|uniref:mRNA cap guanine-N(7) methyltransferase 2 n=1 Tax=Trema orientale TaxID=63057 RepID=A0A2P5C037_TREOI|nr:mRNA (guanine-N(7))-methyltransferase domain containing protein [Trema orientale]